MNTSRQDKLRLMDELDRKIKAMCPHKRVNSRMVCFKCGEKATPKALDALLDLKDTRDILRREILQTPMRDNHGTRQG